MIRRTPAPHHSRTGTVRWKLPFMLAGSLILAGLSFMFYGKVREKDRNNTCQSNLRLLATAVRLYCRDQDGSYPPVTATYTLRPYLTRNNIFKFKVFQCPSQPWEKTAKTADQGDYSYNPLLLHERKAGGKIILAGRKQSEFRNPAGTWLNTDMEDRGHKHLVLVAPVGGGHGCSFTDWHFGGANYSFLDGHIEWLAPSSACAMDNRQVVPAAG